MQYFLQSHTCVAENHVDFLLINYNHTPEVVVDSPKFSKIFF